MTKAKEREARTAAILKEMHRVGAGAKRAARDGDRVMLRLWQSDAEKLLAEAEAIRDEASAAHRRAATRFRNVTAWLALAAAWDAVVHVGWWRTAACVLTGVCLGAAAALTGYLHGLKEGPR